MDVELADPAERPRDDEYDRYVYLVALFRDLAYRADRIQDETPFALHSVLFNSLLVQANLDLAEIARVLGDDPGQYDEWAALTAADLNTSLWSEPDGLYVDYDVRAGDHVSARTSAGLAPLYAGVPTVERARRMVERLAGSRVEVNASGWAVTSLAPDDPGFVPTRYWRGPIWPILNWVLQRGLDRYGFTTLAAEVRRALIDLSGRSGFWEHYNPTTGAGHGGENFAWTAGLVLDILSIEMESKEEGAPMEDAAITPAVDGSAPSSNERRE